MKVYVCTDCDDILHIYKSRKKAEKWLDEAHKKARAEGISHVHFYGIEEGELE